MDSEHRHELQRNDLAEFITNFGQWWRKNGLKTLILLLVVVGAVFFYRSQRVAVETAHDKAWYDLATATTADMYVNLIGDHDVAAIDALAHLRAGDWLHERFRVGDQEATATDAGENGTTVEAESDEQKQAKRQKLLREAAEQYQAVIDDPKAHLAIKLNAMLGLAAVAESSLQWDQARQHYAQIQEMASAGYERIKELAARHTAALERLTEPVIFGVEPEKPKFDMTNLLTPETAASPPDAPDSDDSQAPDSQAPDSQAPDSQAP
jgi:hypothetical protein